MFLVNLPFCYVLPFSFFVSTYGMKMLPSVTVASEVWNAGGFPGMPLVRVSGFRTARTYLRKQLQSLQDSLWRLRLTSLASQPDISPFDLEKVRDIEYYSIQVWWIEPYIFEVIVSSDALGLYVHSIIEEKRSSGPDGEYQYNISYDDSYNV